MANDRSLSGGSEKQFHVMAATFDCPADLRDAISVGK